MVFTSGEGGAAGEAGELPAARRTSARPRPGAEGPRGCGPGRRVPAPPGRPGADSPGPARPPARRVTDSSRPRLRRPRGHHNNMRSCPRTPPRRQTLSPGQRPSRGLGPRRPGPGTRGPGLRASPFRPSGGLVRHSEEPETVAVQPRPLPTPRGPARSGKSSSCPRALTTGSVPQPRAPRCVGSPQSPPPPPGGGPAPRLPLPSSAVRRAHPGPASAAAVPASEPLPPSPAPRSPQREPRGPPERAPGGPQRAPEPHTGPARGCGRPAATQPGAPAHRPRRPEVGDARTHPRTTSSPYFTGSLLGAQCSSWPGENMEPRSAAAASSAAIPAESAPPLQSHPEKGVSAPGKGTAANGARGGQSRGCSVVAARLPRRAPGSSASRGRPEPETRQRMGPGSRGTCPRRTPPPKPRGREEGNQRGREGGGSGGGGAGAGPRSRPAARAGGSRPAPRREPASPARAARPPPARGASRAHSPPPPAGPRGGAAPVLCKHRVKGKGSP